MFSSESVKFEHFCERDELMNMGLMRFAPDCRSLANDTMFKENHLWSAFGSYMNYVSWMTDARLLLQCYWMTKITCIVEFLFKKCHLLFAILYHEASSPYTFSWVNACSLERWLPGKERDEYQTRSVCEKCSGFPWLADEDASTTTTSRWASVLQFQNGRSLERKKQELRRLEATSSEAGGKYLKLVGGAWCCRQWTRWLELFNRKEKLPAFADSMVSASAGRGVWG